MAAECVRRVRNGIDLRPFSAERAHVAGKPVCFGFVGRLSREKGIYPFVEAAAIVAYTELLMVEELFANAAAGVEI